MRIKKPSPNINQGNKGNGSKDRDARTRRAARRHILGLHKGAECSPLCYDVKVRAEVRAEVRGS